jgi:hypothetical protein
MGQGGKVAAIVLGLLAAIAGLSAIAWWLWKRRMFVGEDSLDLCDGKPCPVGLVKEHAKAWLDNVAPAMAS